MSLFRKRKVEEVDDAKRPGDPGWVGRARVPQAEMQEYVSRPQWQTTVQISDKKQKKGVTSYHLARGNRTRELVSHHQPRPPKFSEVAP